jgi:hypothetical protein
MFAFDCRCRYIQDPKKPAEQISTEELERRLKELNEARTPQPLPENIRRYTYRPFSWR